MLKFRSRHSLSPSFAHGLSKITEPSIQSSPMAESQITQHSTRRTLSRLQCISLIHCHHANIATTKPLDTPDPSVASSPSALVPFLLLCTKGRIGLAHRRRIRTVQCHCGLFPQWSPSCGALNQRVTHQERVRRYRAGGLGCKLLGGL